MLSDLSLVFIPLCLKLWFLLLSVECQVMILNNIEQMLLVFCILISILK